MAGLCARAACVLVLASVQARAEETATHAQPALRVTACTEGLASALPTAVNLELDVLRRERGAARAAPDRIDIRCEEDTARIEVTMEGTARESRIDLSALGADHRARAVALATAELVHSMASGAEAVPRPAVTNPAAPPALEPETVSPSRGAWAGTTLAAGGVARWLGEPAALLFGVRAALHTSFGELLAPALWIEGSAGGIRARTARISITELSTGAALGFGGTLGHVRFELGPAVRFGWVRLAGEPDAGVALQGHALSAAWGGPEARARVAYDPSLRSSRLVALGLGAGVVALPVRGLVDGSEQIYAVDGPWFSVSVEVGIGL
jgi:hypothetical protein